MFVFRFSVCVCVCCCFLGKRCGRSNQLLWKSKVWPKVMFPVTLLLKLTCFTLFFSPSFSSRLFRGPHISREDESLTWKSYGRRSVFHVARVYVCSPLSFWLLVPNKRHVLFCTNTHTKNKPHPSVFLFSNGFSLWHSQTLWDVCRVIVCVCSSFSHHSHFPSNRQAEKHMALSFFFLTDLSLSVLRLCLYFPQIFCSVVTFC